MFNGKIFYVVDAMLSVDATKKQNLSGDRNLL